MPWGRVVLVVGTGSYEVGAGWVGGTGGRGHGGKVGHGWGWVWPRVGMIGEGGVLGPDSAF